MELMSNDCFIYVIENPISQQVVYVGQTTVGQRRFKAHLYSIKKAVTPIQKFLKKYISINLNPVFKIIEYVDAGNINSREMFWIEHYKSINPNLLNLTIGGEGTKGRIVSEETKKKMSSISKGRKVSEDTKKKLRDHNIGKLAWNKGKKMPESMVIKLKNRVLPKMSEETKQKIKNTLIAKIKSGEIMRNPSPYVINKMREGKAKAGAWNKGMKLSDEHRANLSKNSARKGKPGTRLGHKNSEYNKMMVSKAKKGVPNLSRAKKVFHNGVVYESILEASRQTGINDSAISEYCRTGRKNKNGLIFSFI